MSKSMRTSIYEDASALHLPEGGDQLAVPLDVFARHVDHAELVQRRQTLPDVLEDRRRQVDFRGGQG